MDRSWLVCLVVHSRPLGDCWLAVDTFAFRHDLTAESTVRSSLELTRRSKLSIELLLLNEPLYILGKPSYPSPPLILRF